MITATIMVVNEGRHGHLSIEIFSGREPRQDVRVQKMGTELVPKTSENRHIPTRLCARENFIVFRRRESFKTYAVIDH